MIEQVEKLLKGLIGLDVESVGRSVIERALQQRFNALGVANIVAYWPRLYQSSSEQQALVEAVVVPETWFFRYPESFVVLTRLAVQRSVELAGSRPLRLLSLPCSSGEEPYSIVMALLDAGLPAAAFQVEALDVSADVLQRARVGRFGRNSFRGGESSIRERYFVADGDAYQLSATVLNKVNLRCGNLLDKQLLAGEGLFDFIFCRNLLIYFDLPTQRSALEGLNRLLREDGTFFVGPAEAGLFSKSGFQALGIPLTFAFQRAAPKAQQAPATVVRRAPVPPPARVAPRAAPIQPPRAPAIPAPAAAKPPAEQALAAIAALANSGRTSEARATCEACLREHGPGAEVFYWLGLLSDVVGEVESAQDYYRKALYLNPAHVEALLHLAALLAAQGDREGARRLQQRAERGVKSDGR